MRNQLAAYYVPNDALRSFGLSIVTSLAHPGGNVTGLSLMLQDVAVKRLEVLKETVPRIVSVAVLWSAANPVYARIVEQLKQIAPRLKLRAQIVRIDSPD